MTARQPRESVGAACLAIGLCLAVWVTFRPLLDGGFFLDDLVRLYDLANYGLGKLLLSPYGGHLLLASNWVYAAFWRVFGLEPRWWFATVVALHAANTVLLFGVLRRFGSGDLVAVAFAALWGLCPVQAGALGWMAVFGHVLLGTIVLVWLRDVAGVAAGRAPVGGRRMACWVVVGVLAATSFAIGLPIALALPLAAPLLLGGVPNGRRVGVALCSLLILVPVLYLGQHALYRRLFGIAPFSTPVTMLRVDAAAVPGQLVELTWYLLDFVTYAAGVLLLGALGGSPGSGPGGTGVGADVQLARLGIPAAILLAAGVWGLWRAPAMRRSHALGLAGLGLAGYVAIAATAVLSGRTQGSMSLGLERGAVIATVAMLPRYHYVPTIFLTVLLALAVEACAARTPQSRRAAWVLSAAVLAWLTVRVWWDRPMVLRLVTPSVFAHELRRLDADVAGSPDPLRADLVNTPVGSGFLALHDASFPGRAALCVIAYPDGVVRDKTVRFIEHDPRLLAVVQAQTGTPIARLVVPPLAVPPDAGVTPGR